MKKVFSLIKIEYKNVLLAIKETKLTDIVRVITRNRKIDDWNDLKSFLMNSYSVKRTEGQFEKWSANLQFLSRI